MYEIRHHLAADGQDVFISWLKQVRDPIAKVQIIKRVNRLELGNFGDHQFCRDGVWELRVHIGPGYRIYYAHAGLHRVLLLGAGDKHTQNADIDRAVRYWQDWQQRLDDER